MLVDRNRELAWSLCEKKRDRYIIHRAFGHQSDAQRYSDSSSRRGTCLGGQMLIDLICELLALWISLKEAILNFHVEANYLQDTGQALHSQRTALNKACSCYNIHSPLTYMTSCGRLRESSDL